MRDCRETWVVCSDQAGKLGFIGTLDEVESPNHFLFLIFFLSLFREFSAILSKVLIYSSDHGNAFCTDLKLRKYFFHISVYKTRAHFKRLLYNTSMSVMKKHWRDGTAQY